MTTTYTAPDLYTPLEPDRPTFERRVLHSAASHLVHRHPEAFARVVRRQRQALGLAYRAAGDRCGLSMMTVWSVERQLYTTTDNTIRAIMTGLGLTIDDIRAEVAAMHDDETSAAMVASLAA